MSACCDFEKKWFANGNYQLKSSIFVSSKD